MTDFLLISLRIFLNFFAERFFIDDLSLGLELLLERGLPLRRFLLELFFSFLFPLLKADNLFFKLTNDSVK
jgi:hypothetical protein